MAGSLASQAPYPGGGLAEAGTCRDHGGSPNSLVGDPLGTAETLRRWGAPGAEAISGAWKGALPCPVCGTMAQVPESALPYHLTLENAHTVLQGLCAAFSQILGQAAELLHRELAPVYLPFSLADLKVKAEVSTERGKGLVYQETQDWVCPENSLFDIRVLDRLEPWNFDEIEPLDPALCKGNPEENIRIVAPSNLQPRGRIIDALLYDRVRDGVMDGFGAGKVDIRRWSYDFHKLDHIALLLPIFFAETPPDPWGNRIATAINGQTGAAAACLRLQEGKRTMMTGRGISVPDLSEHTIRTPVVAVRRVRSPFLHEILPPEKAFRKRGLFW